MHHIILLALVDRVTVSMLSIDVIQLTHVIFLNGFLLNVNVSWNALFKSLKLTIKIPHNDNEIL